jgi:hypothetical protein
VREPKVERAIANETRAPSEARLPNNRLYGNLASHLSKTGFAGSKCTDADYSSKWKLTHWKS